MNKYLVIAHNTAPEDWYKKFSFTPIEIATKWSNGNPMTPPRIMVNMTHEYAEFIKEDPIIKIVERHEDITDEQLSKKMLELYQEGNESSKNMADAMLDVMVILKKLEKEDK